MRWNSVLKNSPKIMIKLNFPEFEFKREIRDGKELIFDPVRRRFVALTPEEWVRQHAIRYLTGYKNVPVSLIRIEAVIKLFRTKKRFDLVVSDRNGNALLLAEFKSPAVAVTQSVLDQAVRYNLALKVKYLVLSNGIQHVYCQVGNDPGSLKLLDDLPEFQFL
ncbi:MAG TPA: type I restriction enzyme HsdR N-terminal domain-containing protein [Bacteroidales bacterium]|nr:type I restriction enzyme HsdR N-terminal domain-containing protein [Bacteroidales bacterium]HPI85342.1 type I restriction enzyme HsdR N-terminal domain-containing protein [Bacteroidales bacterium]HPM92391.1 type I restriction enzyme HsdR N-terminal domain-containing protein [Bacteroidales bacterium]